MIGATRTAVGATAEAQIEGTPTAAFGKYQLFASLGRGGMADVFLSVARGQMGFNKLAVIKRLRQALAEEAAFRNMFLDEARLAARLNHPNIVHTYEVGEQGGVYFIAMEYLEGQSLNKVLKEAQRRREPLEPEISARVIADALAGLGHAHDLRDYDGRPLQIIHRDISPHNLFVTYDGHTKLVDFGIAKAALSSTETEVGVLKGKVAYMSPEQAMGTRIDARSDLFAMGIVLWEMLAGQRLMTGENAANTLHKLMNEPIPRLESVVPGIDPALAAIVATALEKDVEKRWRSAAAMREALEGWLQNRPRKARQEDVARQMQHLFGAIREEVQRQINKHMAAITTAGNTQELQALTAESLRRMEQSGANVSGQLLRLGSGSGSGVIPNYGGLGPPTGAGVSQYPMLPSASQFPSGSHARAKGPPTGALVIVVAVGCFMLTSVALVVFGLRDRAARNDARAVASAPAPTVVVQPPAATAPITPVPVPVTTAPTAAVVETASAPVPTATATFAAPSRPSRPASRPPVSSKPAATAAVPAGPAADKEDPGFLTVSVYPWAKVYEGGRFLCTTPCSKVALSPGTHNLTLENPEEGVKQSLTVSIKSGETTVKQIAVK